MTSRSRLPVDFEAKVKAPPPANGRGYPYQISAKDLMDNFRYLDAKTPEEDAASGGIPSGYAEIEVNICVAGVPTAYTILAKPV